jgi:hypothetical protein
MIKLTRPDIKNIGDRKSFPAALAITAVITPWGRRAIPVMFWPSNAEHNDLPS